MTLGKDVVDLGYSTVIPTMVIAKSHRLARPTQPTMTI